MLDLADKASDLAGLTARVCQLLEFLEGSDDGSGSSGSSSIRQVHGRWPGAGKGDDGAGFVTLRWDAAGAHLSRSLSAADLAAGAPAPQPGAAAKTRALQPLPRWLGASPVHERLAGAAQLLQAPRMHRAPCGGALEVSLHSLGGAGALQERVAAVFPGAPPGAALLAAVTFQFLGGSGGSGDGGVWEGGSEMQRLLEVFLSWQAAVRSHLEGR